MKKFISILFSSIIPTLALSCLFFNAIETCETRFDSQGIYIFSVLWLSFAISFAFSCSIYRMNELKEDIDNLRKEINKQNTNH
jgi:hypothetical protein